MASELLSPAAAHNCRSSSKRPPEMSAWTRKALAQSRVRAAMRIAVVSGPSVDNASATRLARCQLSHAAAISRLANHFPARICQA